MSRLNNKPQTDGGTFQINPFALLIHKRHEREILMTTKPTTKRVVVCTRNPQKIIIFHLPLFSHYGEI